MLPRRPATVKKWLIAIKCCVTYHRLVRETNGIFIDTAAQSGYLGPELELFKDNVSNSAWDFSAFIREYSRYLRKMVQVFKATGFFPEQEAFGTSSKFRCAPPPAREYESYESYDDGPTRLLPPRWSLLITVLRPATPAGGACAGRASFACASSAVPHSAGQTDRAWRCRAARLPNQSSLKSIVPG